MDNYKVKLSDEDLPPEEYDDNKTGSSVTDSFSEGEIEYSPCGINAQTVPGHIKVEQCDNPVLERLITLVTDDPYLTGRAMMYCSNGFTFQGKTKTFIENLKQAKQVEPGTLVFLTTSLYDTVARSNEEHGAPVMVLMDALIFSPEYPVTVLTLTEDSSKDVYECRRYNTHLASLLTETLRDIDDSLSVLHGVVDIDDDLSETLDNLRQQKLCFTFADSLTMTPDRCREDLRYLLRVLSSREINEALPKLLDTNIWKALIMMDLHQELSDPAFGDFICRLSGKFKMALFVEDCSLSLKEKLTANSVNIVDKKLGESSQPDWEVYVECCKKQTLCAVNPFPDENQKRDEGNAERMNVGGEISKRVFTLVFWECALCIVQFILSYKSDLAGSFDFAGQKTIPVLGLLINVQSVHPRHHQKEYRCLISALLFSIIGDLFAWNQNIQLGMLAFAVVNLFYAIAFGFRLDKLMAFCVVTALGAVILATVSGEIEGQTYFIALVYTMSACLLVWRAIAGLETYDGAFPWAILNIVSLACFVFGNVNSGYKLLHPFVVPGANLLSKITYNFTELESTMCLLFRYEMFGDNMTKSRVLEFMTVIFVLLYSGGLPILAKSQQIWNPRLLISW